MAWPGVTASSSANTDCLISIRPGTASTTKSASPKPSYSVVPWIRSSVCSSWRSESSCEIFSFSTRRPSCPSVTCRAFSRPLSTSFWSTSLSTTGISAAANVWAISPPIVPAPTTAALNTSMTGERLPPRSGTELAGEPRLLLGLHGEAAQGPAQGVPDGAADEDDVRQRAQRPVARELVVEPQLNPGPLGHLGEGDRLPAGEGVLLDLRRDVLGAALDHPLRHAAAATGTRLPDEL